jgi:hypothetical protein
MHLYWRIIEELKYLGEIWSIKDPTILRRYEHWIQKHSELINLDFDRRTTQLIHIPYILN